MGSTLISMSSTWAHLKALPQQVQQLALPLGVQQRHRGRRLYSIRLLSACVLAAATCSCLSCSSIGSCLSCGR